MDVQTRDVVVQPTDRAEPVQTAARVLGLSQDDLASILATYHSSHAGSSGANGGGKRGRSADAKGKKGKSRASSSAGSRGASAAAARPGGKRNKPAHAPPAPASSSARLHGDVATSARNAMEALERNPNVHLRPGLPRSLLKLPAMPLADMVQSVMAGKCYLCMEDHRARDCPTRNFPAGSPAFERMKAYMPAYKGARWPSSTT
jgi:hypothetical protein